MINFATLAIACKKTFGILKLFPFINDSPNTNFRHTQHSTAHYSPAKLLSLLIPSLFLSGCYEGELATNPEVIVDPYGKAEQRGIDIIDMRNIEVAILESNYYDLSSIEFHSLRPGDDFGALGVPVRQRKIDVNGDGLSDWLVTFHMTQGGFDREQNQAHIAWIRGTLPSLIDAWAGLETVVRLGSDTEKCEYLFDPDGQEPQAPQAMRCFYYSSYAKETTAALKALNITGLVAVINADADASEYTTRVKSDSVAIIEAFGAPGGIGQNKDGKKGGKGGASGYAVVNHSVDSLEEMTADFDLNLYVGAVGCDGEKTANSGGGGGSTAVSLTPFSEITTPKSVSDPAVYSILLIAGGGGGGGNAFTSGSTNNKHNGKDGGYGAKIEKGSISQLLFKQGEKGHQEDKYSQGGGGGGAEKNGVYGIGGGGGSGTTGGHSGDNGIGGNGGMRSDKCTTVVQWLDTSFEIENTAFGLGGIGGENGSHKQSKGGAGGGGFGSGGGGASGYDSNTFHDSRQTPGGGGSFTNKSWADQERPEIDRLTFGVQETTVGFVAITFEMQAQ